jgi:hypothetical protein
MTQSPDATSDATPGAASDAGTEESRAGRRQRWIVVLSTVGAVVVMAGVIVLAKARGGDEPDSRETASLSPVGLHLPERHPVGPGLPDPFPEGCDVDYDRPPRMVIEVPAEGIDFGSMKQGVRAERDVVVRNAGTGVLCLRRPTGSCGCVKVMLVEEQRKIEPGATATVKVIMDSTGREGTISKSVTIFSNDPQAPAKVIPVKAEVSLGLVVSSLRADFGTVAKDRPANATVRLRSPKTDAAWKVTGVDVVKATGRPEAPEMSWEAKEVEDPAWRIVEVSLRHPGSPTYGSIGGQLRIATTHADRPEVLLPYWMQVVTSVMARPPNASLGFVPRAGHATVRLEPQEGVTFRVLSAEVLPVAKDADAAGPGFLVDFAQAQGGPYKRGTWLVNIAYDGKSRQPGPLRAEVLVKTDAPDAAEIRIPVTATVKK